MPFHAIHALHAVNSATGFWTYLRQWLSDWGPAITILVTMAIAGAAVVQAIYSSRISAVEKALLSLQSEIEDSRKIVRVFFHVENPGLTQLRLNIFNLSPFAVFVSDGYVITRATTERPAAVGKLELRQMIKEWSAIGIDSFEDRIVKAFDGVQGISLNSLHVHSSDVVFEVTIKVFALGAYTNHTSPLYRASFHEGQIKVDLLNE